ncbi:uncharacterized protein [Palaemon carinicauda]|uniref:uncharacterized protein n=1 Tax=Palaemon carinicauda TaxID=392227 RepID=UPI0035B60316
MVVPCGRDTTAARVTKIFCVFFCEVSIPLHLRTDGGPPFSSHNFKEFADRWGVYHIIPSPHYPQSNGQAETALKAVKHLILKTAPCGNIDSHPRSFKEKGQPKTKDYDRQTAAQTNQAVTVYNSHACSLPKLTIGQRVRIQYSTTLRWDKVGIVMGRGMSRNYEVRLPGGCEWFINQRHLRPGAIIGDDISPQDPVSPCSGHEREPSSEPSNVPHHSP